MAGMDYTKCARCDRKVFYDAHVNYEESAGNYGSHKALCKECDKGFVLLVIRKDSKVHRNYRDQSAKTS